MLAFVQFASVVGVGVDAHPLLVEVDVARGRSAWSIVAIASNAVKEARERVASAFVNECFEVPDRWITVFSSPPDGTVVGRRATRAAATELRATLAEGRASHGEV